MSKGNDIPDLMAALEDSLGIPHDHREVVSGCSRCEFSADEVRDQ